MESRDIEPAARAAFEAHQAVAQAHGFPPEHPSFEFSIGMMNAKFQDPDATGYVAEKAGEVVASGFLNRFSPIGAIGPLTVHPAAQGGAGRELMSVLMQAARSEGFQSVRLVQSPYHLRSLALYSSVGFDAREPLLLMNGGVSHTVTPGQIVRLATHADIGACNRVCHTVHGLERERELLGGIERGQAHVVERGEQIVGYTSGLGFLGHAVAETTEDLQAIIASVAPAPGPGFLVPIRNGDLLRWLLARGARAMWPATLMTTGFYQEPAGAFLPAISF